MNNDTENRVADNVYRDNRDRSYSLVMVIISFCLFIITGRIVSFVLAYIPMLDSEAADLISFIISVIASCALFINFDVFVSPPVSADGTKKPKTDILVRSFYPTKNRVTLGTKIGHVVFSVALLVSAMYLVYAAFYSYTEGETKPSSMIIGILSYVIIHPIFEEYIFRGLYYRELRIMSPIFACLMQSVMFAIAHNGSDDMGEMIYALAAGIFLAASAERTNGIIAPIIIHVIINLRTLVYVTFVPENIRTYIDIAIMICGISAFAWLSFTHRNRDIAVGRKKTEKMNTVSDTVNEGDFDD